MPFAFLNTVHGIIRSHFSQARIDVMEGRAGYICPSCGGEMHLDEFPCDDTLICDNCGETMDLERYGFTDEEYEELFECDDREEESDDDPWDDD